MAKIFYLLKQNKNENAKIYGNEAKKWELANLQTPNFV